jgi:hypothetical protein
MMVTVWRLESNQTALNCEFSPTYCPYNKIRTSLNFGTYPTITLAEARNRRKSALVLLSQGTVFGPSTT